VDGYNELPQRTRSSLLTLLSEVLREPMFLLLLAAGGIELLLGDVAEALMLLGFMLVVIAIAVAQGRRTERVLAARRGLSAPPAW
jgi:Ca2+-transporting ATPase